MYAAGSKLGSKAVPTAVSGKGKVSQSQTDRAKDTSASRLQPSAAAEEASQAKTGSLGKAKAAVPAYRLALEVSSHHTNGQKHSLRTRAEVPG